MRFILLVLGVIIGPNQVAAQGLSSMPPSDQPTTSPGTPPHPAPADTLTLASAIRAALSRHPSLTAAEAVVDHAISGVAEATSTRLPQLSTDASFMRFAEPMVTAPLHGFNPQQPPIFDRTLLQGGISLGYTLYDGGARGARRERAEALLGAGEAGVSGARSKLIAHVVQTYLQVTTTAELLDANSRRVAALEEERGRAAQLFERGTAARVTVLRAQAALGAARAEWYEAQGEYEVALGELARSIGVDFARAASVTLVPVRLAGGASGSVDGSLFQGSAPEARAHQGSDDRIPDRPTPVRQKFGGPTPTNSLLDRQVLLERALASNPEILRLQRMTRAAEATRAEARSLWFPTIHALGRYAEYASGLGREQGEWQGGIQFSFPLFTGGTRQAVGDRAAAEARSSHAQLELAQLTIASALDRVLAAVETGGARVAALEVAVEQAAEVARIERLALDAGAGVQTDYLTAEAELLRVRAAGAAARSAEIGARVELARIVGELSIEWLERNLESGS